MSEKKYRVPIRRGIPWALLGAISLAVYLWFYFDTGEYNIYIILITAAVVLIWLARYFRKRHISKQFDNMTDKLSTHYEERLKREDIQHNLQDYPLENNPKSKLCEYCGASLQESADFCENCRKKSSG